ncbi:MAG TPA: hypothetical protein VFY69_00580 [Solirubrobacterales bacterium]|nr:hypothetical protein [Solirubrobacterales bacterium]
MERPLRNPPVLILVAALALAVAGTLALTWGMTFFQDTWAFLINRREFTADDILEPHSEHLVAFPALLEMLLIRIFGMSNALPEYVLLALFLATTAGLLFVYLRRRVGDWLALFATLIVLTLGPAWEVLLWPFEITFIAPILFGLAMLLALERGDRRGDLVACVCLTLAVASSGLGICFIAAAFVAILLGPRDRWLPRAYVFAVPLLLYGLWWLGWGRDAESSITLHNVFASPRFVADSLAWAMQSMLGLAPAPGSGPDVSWGRALLVGAVLLLVYRFSQARPRPVIDPGLWPVATAALANWFLTAFNAIPGRDPSSSRYQYAGVIFVLMILANLLKGVSPGRKALAALGVLTALVMGPNLVLLEKGEDVLEAQSILTQADTAGLEIAARRVDPGFQLTLPVAGTPSLVNVYAGEYLEAIEEHGSPAYSEAELLEAPEFARRQVDILLSQALPLSTEIRPGRLAGGTGECVEVPGGGEAVPEVPLSPGLNRIEIAPGPPAELSLRRFATEEFPVPTNAPPGGSVVLLRVPRDASDQPWHLHVQAEQPARVCAAA